MTTVKYKVVAYVEGDKEPLRSCDIKVHGNHELENSIEEVAEFMNDTWDEAQDEGDL